MICQIIRSDILPIAHIFPRPCGARKHANIIVQDEANLALFNSGYENSMSKFHSVSTAK